MRWVLRMQDTSFGEYRSCTPVMYTIAQQLTTHYSEASDTQQLIPSPLQSKAESVKHHPALTSPLNGDSSCTASRTNSSSSFPAASAQVAPAPEEEDPDMQAFSFSTGNGSGGGGSGGGCCSPDAAHVAVGAPDAGYIASRRLLTMAGVKLRQHKLKQLIVVNPGC